MIEIESKGRINFEFELKGLNSSFDKANRFLIIHFLNINQSKI